MTRMIRYSAAGLLPAFLLAAVPAAAIDPTRINAPQSTERMAATADAKPRSTGMGIFGCSADGNKQTAGAVVGGLLGGFLGNRIAGRGSRTMGTILGGALGDKPVHTGPRAPDHGNNPGWCAGCGRGVRAGL